MVALKPQYITDNMGKKVSVVLSIDDFKDIMEELEELEDIRLYDASKKSKEPPVPIEDAFKMIEEKRVTK